METVRTTEVNDTNDGLNLLEKKMIGIISKGFIRSRDLFKLVNITENAGANTLSKLIDRDIVGVNREWMLYLK